MSHFPTIDPPRHARLAWLALLALFATVWFAFLGHRDLVHPDEGRYAEIPREMVATGDWITPRLDGIQYFEKPPLQYWATAAVYTVFGASNATARLWIALLGFLSVPWIAFVGRRVFGASAGLYAALFLASNLLWIACGHVLTLDMSLSAFLALAIGALLLAQTRRDEPLYVRRWMLVAWLALALATLSKGPVALVLPALAIGAYSLWQRDGALWRHMHFGKGLSLYFIVTAPWFIAMSARHPAFAEFFFIHEHLARYGTDVHNRVHAWWTYLPIIAVGCLPFLATTGASLARRGLTWTRGSGEFEAERFLWTFSIATVAFFSASHSKLPAYVLPTCPAIALLAGRRLASQAALGIEAVVVALVAVLFVTLSFVLAGFSSADVPEGMIAECRPFLLASAALLAAGALVAWLSRRHVARAAPALAIAALFAFQVLLIGSQRLAPIKSAREMADAVRDLVAAGARVYSVDTYFQPLPFYLATTVCTVKFEGELAFGLSEQPELGIRDLNAFEPIWRGADQAVAVMRSQTYAALEERGFPMRRVYEDSWRVAVARR